MKATVSPQGNRWVRDGECEDKIHGMEVLLYERPTARLFR